MNKTFKVERKGKQTWVVIRQMPHDPQYKIGSRIPGYGKVVEISTAPITVYSELLAGEAAKWNAAGAHRTTEDIEQSRAKAATMLWIGTEPCYCAETNAHITAFFQRNACRLIERVAAERGIDLQAEMRKSEAVERTLAELRARA